MLITLLEIVMVNLGLGYDKLECPPGTPVGGPPYGGLLQLSVFRTPGRGIAAASVLRA